MPVTLEQLRAIMPAAKQARPGIYLDPINEAMEEFSIITNRRMAAFLAQLAHESGELRYVLELASGAAYDTGRLAGVLGNTPEADGDGQRYKGRGLIQITGRDNYRACSLALFGDESILIETPALLETPIPAARSAAWFWWSRGLNALADQPNSFQAITRRINKGLKGYAARVMYFDRAKKVLG